MEKNHLVDETMNEGALRRVSTYPIYPRDSYEKFLNIDNGKQSGTLWICLF